MGNFGLRRLGHKLSVMEVTATTAITTAWIRTTCRRNRWLDRLAGAFAIVLTVPVSLVYQANDLA